MANIESIIFDLDGTLVDSQPAAIRSTIEALSHFGIDTSDREVREQFGGGSRKLLSHFMNKELGNEKANELLDQAIKLRLDLQVSFTDQVVLLPNVKELLVLLRDSNYKLALATMSSGAVAHQILSHNEIRDYFDQVVTADDVINVKPDPEILIKTIRLLGIDANRALYCGDSSHDSEAAFHLDMPFLLIDSGLYVRGKSRERLRISVERRGCPVIGLDQLLTIKEIVDRLI